MVENQNVWSYEAAKELALEYFRGDEIAADAYLSKYALKQNSDISKIMEPTPDYMHDRMAREFGRIEKQFKNPLSEKEIFDLFQNFKYIIPQGGSMTGIGNPLPISLSNCFVIGSKNDSYGAICQTDEEQVQLSKRRGGVGHDLSYIRPKGTNVNNAAITSSGMVSFMERFSHSIREVCQDGRRGALMLSCSIKHPQVEDFIDAKLDTGKVTGANISVKLTDEFMECVEAAKPFTQCFPIDSEEPIVSKQIDTPKLWKKIMYNAWKSAEPGILFWDAILNESTARLYGDEYEEISTNPCFTGNTIIAVADGRNGVSIEQLAKENKSFLVYSARKSKSNVKKWKTEIKKAIAFKTGTKKILEITLSDGSTFKCTHNHKLALADDTTYVEAINSLNKKLAKFFTLSNKSTNKSYRHINSKTSYRQHNLLWNYIYGSYDTNMYNIHHKDGSSTNDLLENLELININEHKDKTNRTRKNNPVFKVSKEYRSIINKKRNILANAKKYDCDESQKNALLEEYYREYGERIKQINQDKSEKNVYLDECVTVINIKEIGEEDVYDLTVEDNHNFYIITKTDDDKYLNCSGILVHNCGEVPLSRNGSCILLAINLYSYVVNPFHGDAYFDFELFKHHVKIAQRLADDIIELECEKIKQIIIKIESDPEPEHIKSTELNLWRKILHNHENTRRTGVGITGLGDMIAAAGMTYGTKEATEFATIVQKTLAIEAYASSIQLAKERGCFKIWNWEKERYSPFINRIIEDMDNSTYRDYLRYGRRNIHCLTIAPTGTVSLMTQTTSGIEPVFMPVYKRRRKVESGYKYDFKDENGDLFVEYNVVHHKIVEWYMNTHLDCQNYYETYKYLSMMPYDDLKELLKMSPYHNATTNDVDWLEKVRMQGAMQQYVDHSISVTVNLPKEATVELVSQVYMEAWKSGCKGCTIYREGSRAGVLIAKDNKDDKKPNILPSGARSKRKPVLPAIVDVVRARGQWYAVIIGIDNNMPYEVFAFKLEVDEVKKFKEIKQTTVIKVKKKVYALGSEFAGFKNCDNIINRFGSEEEQAITRMVSTMLRGGRIPLVEIIDQIIKSSASIEKFSKVLAVCLQKFLKDDIQLYEKCPNCGGNMVSYEGCKKCTQCGQSKCG